ncbi:hypothetical protein ACHAWF_001210 [Thalassiosira exigua]
MGSSKSHLPVLAVVVAVIATAIGIGPHLLSNEAIHTSEQSVSIDGMQFPEEIKIAGSKQSLIGGGTRSKWGFRVYSVGIFGDMKLIKSLKKKDLAMDSLSRDFLNSKLTRTLLLRFRRSVASSDVTEALGEALVEKVGKETSTKFQNFILDVVKKHGKEGFETGTDLYITCKGEKLWASLTMEDSSTMNTKGLCSAIFAIYLGSNPVSPQAKEGFEKGFADMTVH